MAFIDSHNHWALAFGIMGNIISLVVYFAPLPTFLRIYKKKSTEEFQSLPYVVALFSAMLWLYYALIKTNAFLLITINSFGCVIEFIYTIVYLIYATKESKRTAIKLIVCMNLVLFAAIILVTQFLVHGSMRIKVLGWICVVISVAVFAAPLTILVKVIRTKSVEFMPLPLSLCLTLSAIFWFAYGFFQKDICVAIPNILGFILGLLQMGLYAMYRKSSPSSQKEKNNVVMSNLGTSEVYPENEEDEAEEQKQECPV